MESESGGIAMQLKMNGDFEIQPLPINGFYNVQRFKQFSPEDVANWILYKTIRGKQNLAMYPAMGRSHINYLGYNQLVFGTEPRAKYKSINYCYVVVGNEIFRVDNNYNRIQISGNQLQTLSGRINFTYLVVNAIVFACFSDGQKIYVYQENTGIFYTVTDPNAPGNSTVNGELTKPGYIATFGNRIGVSVLNSSQFFLSELNLLTPDNITNEATFQPHYCFTPGTVTNGAGNPPPVLTEGAPVFAQENGIIRQMGVLNNTLYIFCDFTTGIWSNIPAIFSGTGASFPWKKNSAYDWNFGIANPNSLDIDFGYIAFLAQNSDGLTQFMLSSGGQPQRMGVQNEDVSEAIDVLLQNYVNRLGNDSPFLTAYSSGFLFQYENKILYRFSGGRYTGTGLLDQLGTANSIEFDFATQTWHRLVELNGERNRIQLHTYFNNKHLVTVDGDNTIYEASGQFYFNEVRNPEQTDPQADNAYLKYPFRYERITPIISQDDLSEFETEYVEIDFVFGQSDIHYSTNPFANTQFVVGEQPGLDGNPQFVISENPGEDETPQFVILDDSNYPTILDKTYNTLFNPSIELWVSDDGGISFYSADVRSFAQSGVYVWKMRWYQLGCSRNRVYKLIAVSAVPIVALGATMNVRRVSGGSN